MNRLLSGVAILVLSAGTLLAQDDPKPDQLKKMYEDAVAQLRAAQDRKSELAKENEELKAKLKDLTTQVGSARKKADELETDAAGRSEKTFFLRSQYAAWRQFVRQYPSIEVRWKLFLEGGILQSPERVSELYDPDWPISARD